jgi:hypothetical protein
MIENKQFCTIEHLDEDGHEIIDHAILSTEEQMKLMEEFIRRGVIATIHEHIPNVNSLNEEIEFDPK